MIAEIFLFFIALYLFYYLFKPKGNLPPGPSGFPFIGNLPLTNIQQCKDMKKKYGNLVMMKVGAYNFLYIFDYKLSKEAYLKLDFANRPDWKMFQFFKSERTQDKSNGVVFSNGTQWHHNRRFLLRHLRDLGMGKSRTEGIIMREVENLVEDFKSLTNKPSNLPLSLNIVALNIIWQLVASHRYEFTDKKVTTFLMKVDEFRKYFLKIGFPDFFPILNFMPKFLYDTITGRPLFEESILYFEDIVQPFLKDHLEKLDPNNPVDLMDDYLIEMKENKSEDYSHFNLSDLTRISFDLFTAGNDTTSSMIRWVLTYMAKFPSIQKKIQAQIDDVVQRDSFPGLEHRDRLTYLDATINEVQRHASMIHLGVMRSTAADVVLGGYHIPQNTAVFSVIALSHCDPTYWKNPDDFDPSRFLDSNGKFIPNCDGFQAFGNGKRQCLGEQFARMELYLIVAGLLQTFTFGPPEGKAIDISSEDDDDSSGRFSKKQDFLIKLRN